MPLVVFEIQSEESTEIIEAVEDGELSEER